jgi:hypothetical protein
MPIENYEIVGSYNNQRFTNIDAERTINMFEYIDPKGKKPHSLISTSGLENTELIFPNAGPDDGFRGEFVLNNFEYFVIGPNIYRRDINNNVTKLNSVPLPTSTGYVGIDANNNANGEQIIFVDGQKGSVWDTGTDQYTPDLRAVDSAFPVAPVDVCFIDGFIVVAAGGTNNFFLSAFNNIYSYSLVSNTFTADPGPGPTADQLTVSTYIPTGMPIDFVAGGGLPAPLVAGTTYFAIFVDATHIKVATTFANAVAGTFIDITTAGTPPNTIRNLASPNLPGQLQQGAINSHPGDIVACRTLHRRVFLFSNFYTEVWENAGIGTNLPLRRNNGLLMEYGTPAIGSIVTGFDKMMFLSQDRDGLGSVMEVIGTESIPVSNRALDFQLAQYASDGQIADAKGIFVKENGIIFYRLNFTLANHTYVYNITLSNPQSEEGKLWHEEEILNGDRHPAQTHGYFNGNNFYGDYHRPVLYQVSPSFVTNDGEAIPRIRIGRTYVSATYNRLRIDRFMLDVIQGQPLVDNISGLLTLLAENENVITAENGNDILLESSSLLPVYSLAHPIVFLSISKDGGVTYGYRQNAQMGAIGQRTFRTVWRKLGTIPRGQGFVPKIEFFNEVPFVVLGAAWSFEVMPE